ncbi:DUF3099 domain-containing protein [Cryobacterium sp. BB307]|uniref:DUF3099 domain-containing protein n=1 Tax=Cryobacterium sp. BB307 TaxID=2716317 RepID=UPI0014455B57|nr:DUF3099 domain-containing protein [Cryobacterium sp. BB307]
MTRHINTITALPRSPEDDRRRRMRLYTLTMSIRVVCIVLCLFVRDWWLLLAAIGATFLPYVAVVLANAVDKRGTSPERPGSIVPLAPYRPQGDENLGNGDHGEDRAGGDNGEHREDKE